MTDTATYFAIYYVIGLVLMALFIRFFLRKRKMREIEKSHPPTFDDDTEK